ncbi:MAG: hypothetical protein ABIN89_08495 [Chitinophagaceae bacterium]
MNKNILYIDQSGSKEVLAESFLSFRKFIEFLKIKVADNQGNKTKFYRFVLRKFESVPELSGILSVKDAAIYEEHLQLLLSIVYPLVEDENEALLAFASALSMEVFYSTNAFFTLLEPTCTGKKSLSTSSRKTIQQVIKDLQYTFILNNLYGYNSIQKKEWIQSFIDPVTGLYKYLRLNINSKFVDVTPKYILPDLNPIVIKSHIACDNHVERLEQVMNLESYVISGFSIITLTDVTAQQVLEQISKLTISITDDNISSSYQEINSLLQTLMGSNKYRFGLMPFFIVNDRAAILYENFQYSIIVNACWNAGVSKEDLCDFISHFLQAPALLTFDASTESPDIPVVIQQALMQAGVDFINFIPVYYNSRLLGIFEIAGDKGEPSDTFQLDTLKPAIPYISQLLRLYIDNFNSRIESIVTDKFTNIQPAVQWKFNEVAWHHFRNNEIEHKDFALEDITFKEVYPLYGAVDMRNSTDERNQSLREDLQLHIGLLIEIFTLLNKNNGDSTASRILDDCIYWEHHLIHYITIEEIPFGHFIREEVNPYLLTGTNLPQQVTEKITYYFNALDEQTGILFQKRRDLEKAMSLINNALGKYFDEFKDAVQSIYPCYFEKFRSDGIEYDIYVGQSIAPRVLFTIQHLHTLRLWQVQTMAEITKLTFSLLPEMQHALETTQLLYVNARPIDITFRTDERRFDVEGTYNIRYHIIKKRIDKVRILNTNERLTQPHKIAIVYFDETDSIEFAGYINQLQQQQILLDDLEYLDLEESQGVTGLKALRVGVKLD